MNTKTLETLLVTVGIEVVAVLLLAGVFFLLKSMKKKKADKAAAIELVETVTANEGSRREGLIKVFGECYEMEDDELNAAVDEFLTREKAFYKTLISVYVDRDSEKFAQLSGALENVVKPYSDLALSADTRIDSAELDELQKQNQELTDELSESKQVMDELMSEYTATFDKELEGKAPAALEGTDKNTEEIDSTDIIVEEPSNEQAEDATDLDLTLELSVDDLVENDVSDKETSLESMETVISEDDTEEAAELESVEEDVPLDLTVELSAEDLAEDIEANENETSLESDVLDIEVDEIENVIDSVLEEDDSLQDLSDELQVEDNVASETEPSLESDEPVNDDVAENDGVAELATIIDEGTPLDLTVELSAEDLIEDSSSTALDIEDSSNLEGENEPADPDQINDESLNEVSLDEIDEELETV